MNILLSYGTDEFGINVYNEFGIDLFRVEADEGQNQDDVLTWLVPMIKANNLSVGCRGTNCGCTDGISHSPECLAEHEETITGGTRL